MAEQRSVFFVNNEGGGFADTVTIEHPMTISQLFTARVRGNPVDYKVRVNGQPVQADYVLQDKDRVSATPTKISGAKAE